MMELRTAREVVGSVHPYVGQEAVAVGVCAALEPRDHLVSHYRARIRAVPVDGNDVTAVHRAAGDAVSAALYVLFFGRISGLTEIVKEGLMEAYLLRPMPVYRQVQLTYFGVLAFLLSRRLWHWSLSHYTGVNG